MTFDDYLKQNNGASPFMYRPDSLAQVLGYKGQATQYLGQGGSPSESTGVGTEAQYGLSPEFETFLRQYDYTPGMQGKNPDVAIRDAQGNVVSDHFRVGDHKGSMMKFMGTAIPALVAGGFGAGALGAFGGGGAAAGSSGAGIGAATGVESLPALTQGAVNSAALGAGGNLLGGAGGALAGGAGIGALAGAAGAPFSLGELGKAAIGPLLSSGVQMYGANQASNAMADATNKANELQKYIYETNRTDNMPALTARNSALEQMQSLLKDPSTLTSQPGYAFGLNEGTKALNSGAASRGMTYSGAQGKALQRYGNDYAGTKLNDSFNRLSALAGSGQAGAGQISQAGQNYGTQVGGNITNQGNANAMPWVVGANAVADGINGLTAYGQRKNWWGG